ENVITDIQHILALSPYQFSENVTRTPRVHLLLQERSGVYAHSERPSRRVHLPENGTLAEEKRLPGVHHDGVEVSLPVSVRVAGLEFREFEFCNDRYASIAVAAVTLAC